ncbi:hypothetical protein MCOR02_012271 [Pyricularia oryzae]|nr:hypothetical protein MCOR02_012271 [Pyricularia oryzae]KAI6327895.1 hypothetical protein MCOR34_000397 [Pyricularia oryzae]KAI6448602.1 hypothetical protein MCOR17_010290 [Pyricularia oryzae]KAI6606103.1 hypothetical protein MCOR04_001024 [Pyricularia oryzae]
MSANEVNIAALVPGLGEDLVLQERPIPSPGPGEVLIRNHSIAVNPIDWKQQTLGVMVESYPKILGSDIAGVVVEAGPAVDNFKPGDRVLAAAPSITTNNADKSAFQTFTVVPASYATKIPDSLTFNQAATLPMAVNTASIAFFANLNLPLPPTGPAAEQHQAPASPIPGDVLLVWSAGSSVGRAVVQIARILGSEVYATASPRHHEQIRKLGASLVLDYRSPTAVADIKAAASAQGKRILVAVDNNSDAESINRVLEVLSDGDEGVRKSLLTMLPVEWIEGVVVPKDVDACLVSSGSRTAEVRAWTHTSGLPRWLERGEIVPQPHRVVPGGLGGLQTALNELKSGVTIQCPLHTKVAEVIRPAHNQIVLHSTEAAKLL